MSGRLGRSLGLDLLGSRVCSMNCVYCESGRLERLTLERKPYVPAAVLLAELAAWEAARRAAGEPLPEVVSLGGLGEPTLNSHMPAIIAGVRRILPGVPVAVLTNASLMTDARVRAELAGADIILPSLDSLVPEEFARVNRAHPGLDPKDVAEGILRFRAEAGACRKDSQARPTRVFLEILLVAGINDSERNLELLAAFCNRLQADRVDVTTLSRPGSEPAARAVDQAVLARWSARLGGQAGVGAACPAPRVAERAKNGHIQGGDMLPGEIRSRILASLARRPQTGAQLAEALLADKGAVAAALAELLDAGRISLRRQGGQDYYQPRTG
ncbi:MAG: radical SAM protein [Proteobacteria bacterium]|nr:radical SAM protein [Pseudomonadota bacterium]MBU1594919.1 radical SAM protein [Pseudomonadota bacterium]